MKERDIPDEWEMKELENCIESIDGGSTPPKSNEDYWDGGEINWATTGDYKGKYISSTDSKITQKAIEETSSKIFDSNWLFITIIGTIGETAIPNEPMSVNQQTVAVKPKNNLSQDYLYYYIQSQKSHLESLGRGGAHKAINQSHIKSLSIPVPPLEEQEEIVQELEYRFASIQATDPKIRNLYDLSKEYRDSAFAHLLSGVSMNGVGESLTLPDKSVVPNDWTVCELNEIADRLRSTYETEPGVYYDLYSFEALDEGKGFFVTDGEEINSRKRELYGGEVLISRLNPRISRVCTVDSESDNKQVASTEFVALDLVSNEISQEFLYQYLKTPLIQEYLMNQTTGSTGSHSRVSFDVVMSLQIPIPPKEEQDNLIKKLSEIEMNTQSVEDSVRIINQNLEEYRKSILSEAFSGGI